jgi:hypothetical protein
MQARYPDESLLSLAAVAATMIIAAFFPPFLRTAAFGTGTLYMYASNFHRLHSTNLTIEVALYTIGGLAFLRCASYKCIR